MAAMASENKNSNMMLTGSACGDIHCTSLTRNLTVCNNCQKLMYIILEMHKQKIYIYIYIYM